MADKIPNKLINELVARTNIVNLIHQKIQLKKHGKNFYANCPFHDEKNPSFTVSEEKQFFYCFSCGIHGNAIDFIMHYNKFNFIESIKELAYLHNMKIMYEGNVINYLIKDKQYQTLYTLMNRLTTFYHNNLTQTSSLLAKKYLANRGLNKTIIKYFAIGFAPEGYSNVIKIFNTSQQTQILLNEVGMIVKNNKGQIYDLFRKRIMFPIRNYKGQVIAFGGRAINHDDTPKYLNSPESNIFCKKKQLYGLYEIKNTNKKISQILIVEGYMDVITLTQFGINYAVASLGTSTTNEHIQQLYKITNKIICCYDGDLAGQKAAWRTLNITIPYLTDNHQMYFMFLPKGEDPDTLIRKIGKKEFTILIEKAQPLSTFLFNKLLTQVNLNTSEGRAQLSFLALPIINKIPGKILRICLRQQLGIKIGILDNIYLEKIIKKKIIQTNHYIQKQKKNTTLHMLITLLTKKPQLAFLVPTITGLEKINLPEMTFFTELVQFCQTQPKLTSAELIQYYYNNNKTYKQLEIFTKWNHMITYNEIEKKFIDILTRLYDDILKKRQEKLIARDRIQKLTIKERKELWLLNQTLTQKI
ncbi:DNA primase [Blochmannia endosymbiont of Camponotus (Colobopsis) obliquus]|uniref:DNA primase n=1 Tax=Blochmannia endosymbiont of Camponotus (Colobopsis) obliquus TaxID=1505597 RepID=UPI00061A7AFF|nr:DNA primase [Blochmannia endosymbiont of Camponotus (Colobopsis) obliquus]AKC60238.1 DNA primase [Blochmannia endosymbiont of Camponotus (Colobopsis) obliquus]